MGGGGEREREPSCHRVALLCDRVVAQNLTFFKLSGQQVINVCCLSCNLILQ